jgi:hypothetical protein
MKYLNKLFLFCIFVASISSVSAQFNINGEFRTKTMLLSGYKQLLNDSQYPYGLVIQRSRLFLDYKKDNLSFLFAVQDIRNWGQDALSANNNNMGVLEAWAKYSFNDKISIKLGRQQIKYDDERLIAASNWTDQGIAHDIAVVQYENKVETFKADMGMAMNNNAVYTNYLSDYTVKNYKYLGYLWLDKTFADNTLDISLMSVMDVNQKPLSAHNLNSRFTIGPNINYKKGKLKMSGIFYYQGGRIADGKKVNANFFSAKIGYKIAKNLELAVAFDHYSGTDYKDTTLSKTKTTSFDKLYGTSHSFLGYMDYFTGNAADITKGSGINDFYIRATYDFKEKHSLEATYHMYNLDKAYFSIPKKASIAIDKNLGSEIDLIYTYKHSKTLNVNLGYCIMLPTKSL